MYYSQLLLLIWTNYLLPLALRYRLMVGNAYTKRLLSAPGAARGKALFLCLNRRGKSLSC